MDIFIVTAGIVVASLVLNALVTKWSTKRMLGLEVSVFKSVLVVATRSCAALLAGLAIGYLIKAGSSKENLPTDLVQIAGVIFVGALSFFVYWLTLGKVTGTKVHVWAMTKTVAVETGVMIAAVIALSLVISLVLVLAGIDITGTQR